MDAILKAINYADRKEHGGQGYTLRVNTSDGRQFEVSVHNDNGRLLLKRHAPDEPQHDREVFFNPDNITSVEVVW